MNFFPYYKCGWKVMIYWLIDVKCSGGRFLSTTTVCVACFDDLVFFRIVERTCYSEHDAAECLKQILSGLQVSIVSFGVLSVYISSINDSTNKCSSAASPRQRNSAQGSETRKSTLRKRSQRCTSQNRYLYLSLWFVLPFRILIFVSGKFDSFQIFSMRVDG